MANPGTPPDELRRRYNIYIKCDKSQRATAQALGMTRAAVRSSIANYLKLQEKEQSEGGLIFPEFPAEDISTPELINRLKETSRMRRASYEAHTWFPVQVKDRKPIGVMWFGDPHVDDNGCDWETLDRDTNLCRKPGVYGVNIGDTTNNWIGRLIAKYGDQRVTVKQSRQLAAHFMLDSGIRWLIWLLGNHDQWNDGAAILDLVAKRHKTQRIIMHDWEARFSLNFWNGAKFNIWAAHDFPGDSMWNPLHGPVKAARFGPDVDLLVCGHKHNWGVSQWELGDKGTTPVMIRTRGYKFDDEYARKIGKIEQKEGCSIFTIFNPLSTSQAGRIMPFVDVEAGVDYLQFLRGKHD